MKDWRKLRKRQLIHLIETMHSDSDIRASMLRTREDQKEMAAKSGHTGKEVCRDCKAIAEALGIS